MIDVELKLQRRKYVEKEWDTLSWSFLLFIFGSLKSLPNKIGYLLGLSSKKLRDLSFTMKDTVVIQPGAIRR